MAELVSTVAAVVIAAKTKPHAHLRQSKFISLIIISETLSVNSGWPASANGVFCR